MPPALDPLSFVVACLAFWLSEHQQPSTDYLTEENRSWGYDRIHGALANLGHISRPAALRRFSSVMESIPRLNV